MEKETYDVVATSRGLERRRPWTEEDRKRWGLLKPIDPNDYEIIETPSCFLRIYKSDITVSRYINYVKEFFALYRVNPYHECTVQYSVQHGRWVNVFARRSSPEDAKAYVAMKNEALKPFADSPYSEYSLDEILAIEKEDN